jgi:hypothetical protein
VANSFNMVALIGWFVLGFSSIFVWTFGANADLSFLTFRGEVQKAIAEVTKVEETGASENKQKVMASHYQYSVAGRPFTGIAYATGSSLDPGQKVEVEFKPDDPSRSRVPGFRRAMFGPFVLFILVFPAVAIGLIYGGWRMGRRRNHALEHGLLANGKLIARNPTNITVNKQPVWEYVFEFTARDGRRHQAKARTTNTWALEDEDTEPLLYDPADPERAYVLDEAPARPELDDRGEIVGRPLAFARLLLPGIVIAANAAVVVLMTA